LPELTKRERKRQNPTREKPSVADELRAYLVGKGGLLPEILNPPAAAAALFSLVPFGAVRGVLCPFFFMSASSRVDLFILIRQKKNVN
jgi:hypothetical protein